MEGCQPIKRLKDKKIIPGYDSLKIRPNWTADNLNDIRPLTLLTFWITISTSRLQSNLGSRTPRIMNNSVYEQIFRTRRVSDDVLCLELRTRTPSKNKKNPLPNNNISLPHHLPLTLSTLLHTGTVKLKLSFRLYLICLVLCLSFFVIDLMVSTDFVLRTCAHSTVVKV